MAGIFFADESHQPTRGKRGKTTGRKSTKTVRGPEGAWIAQMKEELAAAGKLPPQRKRKTKAQKIAEREAEKARWAAELALLVFEIFVETSDRGGPPNVASGGRFKTRAEAEAEMVWFPLGSDRSYRELVRTRVWIEGPEA